MQLSIALLVVSTQLVAAAPLERRQAKMGLEWVGVNIAGGEFAPDNLPGTLGTDYFFDNITDAQQYFDNNINAFRLPFLWERMQPTLGGELDPTYLQQYTDFVKQFSQKSKAVILDMHNYGQYHHKFVGVQNSGVSSQDLATAWIKVAQSFSWCKNCLLGLNNEPWGNTDLLPNEEYAKVWAGVTKDVVTALRNASETRPIIVTTLGSFVDEFQKFSGAPLLDALKGQPNIIYELHSYWDKLWNAGGNYGACSPPDGLIASFTNLTNTFRQQNAKAILGEFSSNRLDSCDFKAASLVDFLGKNNDVWQGVFAWGGGVHYGRYQLSGTGGDAISLLPDDNGKLPVLLTRILNQAAKDPVAFDNTVKNWNGATPTPNPGTVNMNMPNGATAPSLPAGGSGDPNVTFVSPTFNWATMNVNDPTPLLNGNYIVTAINNVPVCGTGQFWSFMYQIDPTTNAQPSCNAKTGSFNNGASGSPAVGYSGLTYGQCPQHVFHDGAQDTYNNCWNGKAQFDQNQSGIQGGTFKFTNSMVVGWCCFSQ